MTRLKSAAWRVHASHHESDDHAWASEYDDFERQVLRESAR